MKLSAIKIIDFKIPMESREINQFTSMNRNSPRLDSNVEEKVACVCLNVRARVCECVCVCV